MMRERVEAAELAWRNVARRARPFICTKNASAVGFAEVIDDNAPINYH